MNRGATWGKWDLHIHTPASYEWRGGKRLRDITSDEERQNLLKEVVEGINASGCVAVAVMDYWTFDGVKALRAYLKRPDAVKCNATIFPGIELRMVSPGDFRLNMHAVLNPDLSDDKLDAFKTQLKLSISGKPLTDGYLIEWARNHISAERIEKLGMKKEGIINSEAVALEAASKTAEVLPDSVGEALRILGERDAVLFVPFDTSDGVTKIRFREHYSFPREALAMEAIFEVSSLKTRDAFVGIKTAENEGFFDEFMEAIKHPKLAVRGSDAHKISEYGVFPSGKSTWIKASPTFAGLLQACREPGNRSYIGSRPPKLDFVDRNPHLFLKTIRVRKKTGAPEPGAWFDPTELPLNQDLVALVGRKGSGKSALADVIGMLGDTPNGRYFSFLSDQRFRLSKDNKASSFEAQLEWVQDTKELEWRTLSEARLSSSVARVKYLPQRYFEELCNDHVRGDDSLLQSELRTVIFSHIPSEERKGAATLEELIRLRTDIISSETSSQQTTLTALNARILELTSQVDPAAKLRAREELKLSLLALRALYDNKPAEPIEPQSDNAEAQKISQRISEIQNAIDELKDKEGTARSTVDSLRSRKRDIADSIERIQSFERTSKAAIAELATRLAPLGIDAEKVIKLTIDLKSLQDLTTATAGEIVDQEALLNLDLPTSHAAQLAEREKELRMEKEKLEGPLLAYQEELAVLRSWNEEWASAVGTVETDGSFRNLWFKVKSFAARRTELQVLQAQRVEVSVSILEGLQRRAAVLRELFAPVQSLIDGEPAIREALGVQFSVRFSFDAFATRLFDYIKQSSGSFVGVEESKAYALSLVAKYDLSDPKGLRAFLAEADTALNFDIRGNTQRPVPLSSILRSDRTPADLYDFLYGLSYFDLSYGLMLGSVELERLSPGQRGALLLIFYLLVDRERIPIILDQPEENLDNETVYNLLVGVINRAKQHRQVVMVTHNANLAVACDAEQVIVCTMERDGSNRIKYDAGSIEELHLNQSVVNILEGTKPAFENRRRKYV